MKMNIDVDVGTCKVVEWICGSRNNGRLWAGRVFIVSSGPVACERVCCKPVVKAESVRVCV